MINIPFQNLNSNSIHLQKRPYNSFKISNHDELNPPRRRNRAILFSNSSSDSSHVPIKNTKSSQNKSPFKSNIHLFPHKFQYENKPIKPNAFSVVKKTNKSFNHYFKPMNHIEISEKMETLIFGRNITSYQNKTNNFPVNLQNPPNINFSNPKFPGFELVSAKNTPDKFVNNSIPLKNDNFSLKKIKINKNQFNLVQPIHKSENHLKSFFNKKLDNLENSNMQDTMRQTASVQSKEDSQTIQKNFYKNKELGSLLVIPIPRNMNSNYNSNSTRTIQNHDKQTHEKRKSFPVKKSPMFLFHENFTNQSPDELIRSNIGNIMKVMSKVIYDRSLRKNKNKLINELFKCLKPIDLKLTHLVGFKNLLYKFMKNEDIVDEDLDITSFEIILFCLFLVKKRYLDLEAIEWTAESLNSFKNQEMLKRSEQNYKVILKRAFKTLIACFNTENSILGGSENDFYEHYFREIADKFQIDIENFKPQKIFNELKSESDAPKDNKRKSKKEFARILKKSSKFMQVLIQYLNDELLVCGKTEGIFKDCMKELDRKLPLMIFNWQKKLGIDEDFKSEFINFLANTLMNDKVKLPWSANEVTKGVTSVLRLFRKA